MKTYKLIFCLWLFFFLSIGCSRPGVVKTVPPAPDQVKPEVDPDRIFLMGIGILRLNWADVRGDELRFRYSDLGLPAELSTRERASFTVDGTFADGKYSIDGYLNYDPENRITEPPLDFLVTVGNKQTYLSVGDYRAGIMLDSIFSRYYHPFRGGILFLGSSRMGIEITAGMARGESGIEEFLGDLGSGPYYLRDAPLIRGSETVFLVARSALNPDIELRRTPLNRNVDYFVDYDRGSLLFTYPLSPFDEMGNPVSILITYQFESLVGSFSRMVMGFRSFLVPLKNVKVGFSYLADADSDIKLGDFFREQRAIYTLNLNIDSGPLLFYGEVSRGKELEGKAVTSIFGGGTWNLTRRLRLYFNSWSVDRNFPTFANEQLQYGYSLFQALPTYAQQNIFLSPFQFTRNLGAELFPFSLSRVAVAEKEIHGFLEYENDTNRVSLGYGTRREETLDRTTDTFYLSTFHNAEKLQYWGKVGLDRIENAVDSGQAYDTRDLLLGTRTLLKKIRSGDLFLQVEGKLDWIEDPVQENPDTRRQTYSISSEYLVGGQGLFAGYRREVIQTDGVAENILEADIIEAGIKRNFFKSLFVDARYRFESATAQGGNRDASILSVGAGVETQRYRAMVRYEVQLNDDGLNEGRRRLWTIYLFGAPVHRMSINLNYYKQMGRSFLPISLTEDSEEQFSFRLLWRPVEFLNLYSQWRYDTNALLYPYIDTTRSRSLASVQGLKLVVSRRLEFLANYKLIKVWGPIDNRKYTMAAELGYLIFHHLRLGAGLEIIDFEDDLLTDGNYHAAVGYFKLVTLF